MHTAPVPAPQDAHINKIISDNQRLTPLPAETAPSDTGSREDSARHLYKRRYQFLVVNAARYE